MEPHLPTVRTSEVRFRFQYRDPEGPTSEVGTSMGEPEGESEVPQTGEI